jgi:hypothetical protein
VQGNSADVLEARALDAPESVVVPRRYDVRSRILSLVPRVFATMFERLSGTKHQLDRKVAEARHRVAWLSSTRLVVVERTRRNAPNLARLLNRGRPVNAGGE